MCKPRICLLFIPKYFFFWSSYARSWKKQESSRKTSISALLAMPKPLTVWITINCGNSERDGNTRPPDLPLEKSVCRSGSKS